jgi:uncharacterized protein (TIGR02646 family)
VLRFHKGKAPTCLATLQSTPGASWEGSVCGNQRQEIREHLADDQGELCVYCLRRARPTEAEMRIDHFVPRARGGPHFAWNNLLGACTGLGSDAEGTYETCDRKKKDQPLTLLDPREPNVGDPSLLLRYHADGRIHSEDPRAADDVERVLNLNAPHLTRARKAVLDGLRLWMGARKPDKAGLRAKIQAFQQLRGSSAPEFSVVHVYHLQRWLRAMP